MTVLDARLFPNCKLPFKTGALRVLGAEKGGEASSYSTADGNTSCRPEPTAKKSHAESVSALECGKEKNDGTQACPAWHAMNHRVAVLTSAGSRRV